jgi:hypothetical protein
MMAHPRKVMCKHCKTWLYFAHTPKGHKVPIEATPNSAGTVLLTQRGMELHATFITEDTAVEPGRNIWRVHYGNCPTYKKRGQ